MERSHNIQVNCGTKDVIETEVNSLGAGSQSMVPANNTPLVSGEDADYPSGMVFGSFEPETLARYGIAAVDQRTWRRQKCNSGLIVRQRPTVLLGRRKVLKKEPGSIRLPSGLEDPNLT
jgi:hypothetical protein